MVVTIDSAHNVKCYGQSNGAVYISISGGTASYVYAWSNSTSNQNLANVPVGNYTVNVTDAYGCTATASDSISQPAALAVTVDSVHNAKCYGQSSGAVFITVSGGTPSYVYAWSNSTSNRNLTNVPMGNYTVNVTDVNGCTATASDSISQPAAIAITIDSISNNPCHNSSDGSITVSVSGGTVPYQYAWTGGATTANLTLKPAGIYDLTVTDYHNCTATATDSITAPPAISATSTISNQVSGILGSITTTASGGVPPYSYKWAPGGETVNSISNLVAGVYTDTITDANGCTYIQKDTVSFVNSIIEINDAVRDFNVYPNPSTGVFTVQVDLNQALPIQLEVYSITGQLLAVQAQTGPQNNTYRIDMTDQADGVYMIKLIAGDYTLVRRVTLVK